MSSINLSKLMSGIAEINSVVNDENLTLFISFDIVNSSKFKESYSNWFNVIYLITEKIRKNVLSLDDNMQVWRSIGDEIVFIININSKEKIKTIIQDVFVKLNEVYNEIRNGSIFNSSEIKINTFEKESLIEQNMLSIKASAWIALISNDIYDREKYKYNIRYEYDTAGSTVLTEFQGNDIDSGFRISKHNTNPRRLTLSLELAYILSKDKSYNPKLHIISYRKLKGIWGGKPYPVIWYHDEYIAQARLEDSFYYFEEEEQELVKEYKGKLNKVKCGELVLHDAFFELEKIISDRNMKLKISKIEEKIKENNLPESSKPIDEGKNLIEDLLELHCVAVCVNNDNKVLMLKRSEKETSYPGKWEFGCSRMRKGLTFKQCLKEDYKFFANIDIEVGKPFRDYEFEKDNQIISGVRFMAKIINSENIKVDGIKYCEYKFVNLEEFDKGIVSPVIDIEDFREIIQIILKE